MFVISPRKGNLLHSINLWMSRVNDEMGVVHNNVHGSIVMVVDMLLNFTFDGLSYKHIYVPMKHMVISINNVG